MIQKNRLAVNNIPFDIYYEAGCTNRPLIFFLHGYLNNKDEGASLGRILAHKGFVAVCPDAFMHGARLDEQLIHAADENFIYLMFQIVEKTGEDVLTLIDFFADDKRIDINRIGIAGYSMGAFTSFLVMTKTDQIKVACPVIGVPCFSDFWNDYIGRSKDEAIKHLDTPEFRNHIFEIDPFEQLTGFAPKPLLMINGRYDDKAPVQYAESLYELLAPYYKNAACLKLNIHECGHEITTAMFNEMIAWFETYLR